MPELDDRSEFADRLNDAGENLRMHRHEQAVRAYALCIALRPEEADELGFNLALARHRFHAARGQAGRPRIMLCGHDLGPGADEQALLGGVVSGADARGGDAGDLRLRPDARRDLRAQIFDAVLHAPCDVLHLTDRHYTTLIWAMFARLLWNAEIRQPDTAPLSLAAWQATAATLPAVDAGQGFTPESAAFWQRLLADFPIGAAAPAADNFALWPDEATAAMFALTGGWHGLCPPVIAPGLLRITRAHIQDFTLHLAGIAAHPDLAGVPVRLQAMMGDRLLAEVIAAEPDGADLLGMGGRGFHFALTAPISETDLEARLRLRLLGTHAPTDIPLTLWNRTDALAAPPVEVALPPDAEVIGQVNSFGSDFVWGWALCPQAPDAPVAIELLLDGRPCSYSRTGNYREDIRAAYGGAGFNGFRLELPGNLVVGRSARIEVRPIGVRSAMRNTVHVTPAPPGIMEPALLEARRGFEIAPGPGRPGRISVVMLNRNGADLLEEMFASCAEADIVGDVEWIVVDHDSTDASAEVGAAFAARGADIRVLVRRGNYSFAESCNYGAAAATGDILLFANNDLIFRDPFAERLRDYLSDPSVGMLGVKLLDHSDAPHEGDAIQHLGVFFNRALDKHDFLRAFEARCGQETDDQLPATRAVCVTAAFCAMRRQDFDAVGGFDARYSYGMEDVDLCLKVHAVLDKQVVCANDIAITHHRGFSRNQHGHLALRRQRNSQALNRRWGNWLRRRVRRDQLADPAVMTGSRPVIGFACREVGNDTSAGEYFTALELGRALQQVLPCHVRYIPETHWYDLTGVDVLITMTDGFDLARIEQASPWLITVNWMRQWFDRWVDLSSTVSYDVLLASSAMAARYVGDRLGRAVGVLPIAASPAAAGGAAVDAALRSDYVFTGSRLETPRAIESQLDPASIDGVGKVFGHHWEGTPFAAISAGPLPYSRIPEAYAATSIVLDDGHVGTSSWGSCNNRIFDAIAAGCLPISNSTAAVAEMFGDLVPTFDSRETLTAQLNHWLGDDAGRKARIGELQAISGPRDSYVARARALIDSLSQQASTLRIAIKSAAKTDDRAMWGDFHFAEGLAAALRQLGHVVRVDCREAWYSAISHSDDVAIVLRGLTPYQPRPHQLNILWLISHPHDVPVVEMGGFDHVYVASQPHSAVLARDFGVPASFLPQCTDTRRFFWQPALTGSRPDRALYVGNSRNVFRDPVRWAVQHQLPMEIYGGGWEPFVTDTRYRGKMVPNAVLGEFYASSRLVICDHWDDMRKLGYVANRIFDVLASGGRPVVDHVAGLTDLVPERFLSIYETEDEFVAFMREAAPVDMDLRREAAEWAAEHHSFDARGRAISAFIAQALARPPLHM